MSDPRVLVVRQPDAAGRRSQLVDELDRRGLLAGIVHPQLSRHEQALIVASSFRPSLSRWRARGGFGALNARRQTASVQRALTEHRGDHDVILQLQTLCAPGSERAGVPYALYTDNTMALTQRHYPAWARLSDRRAEEWMSYEAGIFGQAKVVCTYSEFTRRSVIDDYGCSPASVVAIGAGANQALDSLEGRDYSSPRALFVGFDFERKGGSVLLEAWPLVRRAIPDAELLVAGPRRRRGRLPPGIEWVGRSDRQTLARLYRSATVFAMPSLFEPWGHVFVEAMSHGLACVGTTACAMPEIIDDRRTGRLVAPGQPEPLAEALCELLCDPAKRAAMGAAAYESARRERRWSHVADRLLARISPQLGRARAHQERATAF
jgi:glycosyltransferase involved in cell wall biosynthesis